MYSDPQITVTCDGDRCYDEFTIGMEPVAQNGWDMRNADAQVRREGWVVDGDAHYCEDCAKLVGLIT